VINIASSSFSRGRPNTTVYSSAKAGVVNFTQGWAEERSDLHIHAVIPQRTNTAMRRHNFPNEDAAGLLDPFEVAQSVVDLLIEPEITGLLVEVKQMFID
jgi:ribitol-5-phosphate 2-dehydrogenase (NADP+) / D-ribitol-5-phosphate cytidylyltransferase